ncbi:MAG: sulfite exporter TauE/SafE family protein [Bdellovibrio sp.]|nr:sulfite exporter TauE/SafE family protein [Bdellovibrio sp.]
MNYYSLFPILLTGLMIAVLHAAIPTHWLPFVIASRAQKWSWQKTQSILLIAGLGHVIMTTLIGALIFVLGLSFFQKYQSYFLILASASIGFFGIFQIVQHFRGHRHSHCDHGHGHAHHHHFDEHQKTGQDGWAILSLLSLLTFSPCESFLPVYLSAVHHGWQGFLALSLILAFGTLFSMLALTWVSMLGLSRFEMNWIEDNEKLVTGIGLLVLSILVFVIENHQH